MEKKNEWWRKHGNEHVTPLSKDSLWLCGIHGVKAIIAEVEQRTWEEVKKMVAEEALQYEAELEENIGYVSINAAAKAEELRHLQSLINSRLASLGEGK